MPGLQLIAIPPCTPRPLRRSAHREWHGGVVRCTNEVARSECSGAVGTRWSSFLQELAGGVAGVETAATGTETRTFVALAQCHKPNFLLGFVPADLFAADLSQPLRLALA